MLVVRDGSKVDLKPAQRVAQLPQTRHARPPLLRHQQRRQPDAQCLQVIQHLAELLHVAGHGLAQQLLEVGTAVDERLHEGDHDVARKLCLQRQQQQLLQAHVQHLQHLLANRVRRLRVLRPLLHVENSAHPRIANDRV